MIHKVKLGSLGGKRERRAKYDAKKCFQIFSLVLSLKFHKISPKFMLQHCLMSYLNCFTGHFPSVKLPERDQIALS